MLPKNRQIMFFASDFEDEEFKGISNHLIPLIDMGQLWKDAWLDQFKDQEVIIAFKNPAHLMHATGAGRRLMDVATIVSVVCVPEQYGSLTEELERASQVPDSLERIESEDFAAMIDPSEDLYLHPAQDFSHGVFYYGVTINRQPFLVSSDGEIVSFTEAARENIILKSSGLPEGRFSQQGVVTAVMGMRSVSPPALHREIAEYIKEYVYLRDSAMYDLLACWVMGTYVMAAFSHFPYLHINAERGSGKTLLLEVIAPLCFNGEILTNPSGNSLVRLIEKKLPTLLIDETEALTNEHAMRKTDLMAILRTGYSSEGRVMQSGHEMPTYCPKAFAGISPIDDVLADRTITVKMTRKTNADSVSPYLHTEEIRKSQARLRDDLYSFGLEHGPRIARTYATSNPSRQDIAHLRNRSYDIWLPPVTIADVCGATASVIRLSQIDVAARQEHEGEQDDMALLIQGLIEASKQLAPIKAEDKVCWYNPDLVHSLLLKEGCLPRRMSKTALSRHLRQKLDIKSVPVRIGLSVTRLYVIDWNKIDEYSRRYFANSSAWKSI